jgi:butyryl-CoA dehydrogenase
MYTQLTDEQEMCHKMFRDFGETRVLPHIAADGLDPETLDAILDDAAQTGLIGIPISIDYGGGGMDCFTYSLLIEELGRASLAVALSVAATSMSAMAIDLMATSAQKDSLLLPLAGGQTVGALAVVGVESAHPKEGKSRLEVRIEDSGLVLNGELSWVVNGRTADSFVVVGLQSDYYSSEDWDGVVVQAGTSGVSVAPSPELVGLRNGLLGEVAFADCSVSPEQAMKGTQHGRDAVVGMLEVSLASALLGAAQFALDESLSYSRTRQQFGSPIAGKEAIRNYLSRMATSVESLRQLLYHTARLFSDEDAPIGQAAMCRLHAGQVARHVVDRAVQIHGGIGQMVDYPIARLYCDLAVVEMLYMSELDVLRSIAASLLGEVGREV